MRASSALLLAAVLATAGYGLADPVATGTSVGSCYESTTHIVACFTSADDCTLSATAYEYATGYVSGHSGCCHCLTGCAEAYNVNCTYYDTYDEYVSVSDVSQHARMTLDVTTFENHVGTPNYTAAYLVYANGENSEKSSGMRTLHGFATAEHEGEDFFDAGASLFGSATWLDDFMTAALEQTGVFEGASDAVLDQAADKTAQCILTRYASHELYSALGKIADGNTADTGAPHAWDEGFVFHYGTHNGAGVNSVWEVQGKRDSDFGTSNQAMTTDAFVDGLAEVRAADAAGAETYMRLIEKYWMITYIQAGLKYAYKYSKDTTATDELVEGYAYFRCGAPLVYLQCESCATTVVDAYESAYATAAATATDEDFFCTVYNALMSSSALTAMGLTADDVGTYDTMNAAGEACTTPTPSPSHDHDDHGDSDPAAAIVGLAAAAIAAVAA